MSLGGVSDVLRRQHTRVSYFLAVFCSTAMIREEEEAEPDSVRRDRHAYQRSINRVIELTGEVSVLEAARQTGQTRDFVRYWQRKGADPDFHPGPAGGDGHSLLSEAGKAVAEAMLFAELQRDDSRKSADYALVLQGRGYPVDKK